MLFIDAILGEGSYAGIKSFLTSDALYNYNLGDLIDYIQGDLGIDIVGVVRSIDGLINDLYPILDGVELPDFVFGGGHVETHPSDTPKDDSIPPVTHPVEDDIRVPSHRNYALLDANADMAPDASEQTPGILETLIISELGMTIEELLANEELRALSVGYAIETLFGITVDEFKGQLTPIFQTIESNTVYSLAYSMAGNQPSTDELAAIKTAIDGYIDIISGLMSLTYTVEDNTITSIVIGYDYTDFYRSEGLIGKDDNICGSMTISNKGLTVAVDVVMGENVLDGSVTIVLNPEVTIDEDKIDEIQQKVNEVDPLTSEDIINKYTLRYSDEYTSITNEIKDNLLYIFMTNDYGVDIIRIDLTKQLGCFTSTEDTFYFIEVKDTRIHSDDDLLDFTSNKDEWLETADYGSHIETVAV